MCSKSFMLLFVMAVFCSKCSVSQQAPDREKSSIIDFVLCGFENIGANCVNQLLNGFSNDLAVARRHLYVQADHELERNLEARRLTVYEVHGYRPSTLMRVLESSFKGVVEMAGGVLSEIWSQPRTAITSRQFGGEPEQEYESDGFLEVRGKKKKRKHQSHHKGMMNVFMIASIIKAKIDLICKIISTKLQIQFAIISTIGLILNIARFWMDYRQLRNNGPLYASPPPPLPPPQPQSTPYSNDQQNTSYDDANKQQGYYPRSLNRGVAQLRQSEAQALAYNGYGPY